MSFIQTYFGVASIVERLSSHRSEHLAGSLERISPFAKSKWTLVRSPSAERFGTTFGTTVLHFQTAQAGSKASLSIPITDTIAIIGVFPVVPRESP